MQSIPAKQVKPRKAHPIRMCVGCRGRAPQASLLRVAMANSHLELDPGRRLPGRGAYVHRDMTCIRRATRRGSFARALRARLDAVSSAELQARVAALLTSSDSSDSSMHLSVQQNFDVEKPQPKGQ